MSPCLGGTGQEAGPCGLVNTGDVCATHTCMLSKCLNTTIPRKNIYTFRRVASVAKCMKQCYVRNKAVVGVVLWQVQEVHVQLFSQVPKLLTHAVYLFFTSVGRLIM